MATVLVTGGSGKLGRAVVAEFADAGWSVVSADRSRPAQPHPGVAYIDADLTDHGQVLELVSGVDERVLAPVDAIVHLAAIPAPGLIPDVATYRNNTSITYSVFSAARRSGVRRVVWASSETLLGLPFAQTPPPYFPVDEEYPVRPNSSYSLSKAADEEIARHFARWEPESAFIGLRYSNVMDVADYAAFPAFEDDPHLRSWNAWGYIDARDGAVAARLAVESDVVGAENFIIASPDSVMSTGSAELAAQVFPDIPFRREVEGTETLLSIDKARRLLGYDPQHSWRDAV